MKSFFALWLLVLGNIVSAQAVHYFTVNRVERKAIFFEPKKPQPKTPVVFVFHGHGGNAQHASSHINFHAFYPEALDVYMQGMPGVNISLLDKEGKYNGWQMNPNDLGNRDVLFFDEVLQFISQQGTADLERIYAVGHSNGSRFVNVLWLMRPNVFAAFVTVAGPGGFWMKNAPQKSVWISFGNQDKIVPSRVQQFFAKQYLKYFKASEGTHTIDAEVSSYQTSEKKEIIIEERNAGHEFPQSSIPKMVAFLKRNLR